MPSYRYLFCDLLTNEVNIEVPCYGVSYGRELNKAADGTLSINLDRTDYANSDVIAATVPGRTVVYYDRNGSLIWGGILWSRTYQAQAKVLSFTMQTFESFFHKIDITTTLTYTNRDQRNILCELVQSAQLLDYLDLQVQFPDGYPFSNGINRTVTFYDYDDWTFGKAMEYMAEYDQGLDYTIDVYYDSNGNPAKRLLVDNDLGIESEENKGLVFEFPGNISNYYWPENASRGAVTVHGRGSGDGTAKLKSTFVNTDLLAAGYPNLQTIYSNSDVSVQATLDAQTAREGLKDHIPITVPTIQVDPDKEPQVGSWALGDTARVVITDARFPEQEFGLPGKDTTIRIIGYTASPPSEGSPETINLIIDGADSDV